MHTEAIAYPSELPIGAPRERIAHFKFPNILRKIVAAALFGVCSGLALAAWHVSRVEIAVIQRPVVERTAPAVILAVPAAAETQREIERLQVRNRRLEALITVLRERKRHAPSDEP